MLFRTRHVEDSSGSKIAEENAEENDDGIEDQFVSLWLDVEDEASALGGDEVVWRVVGRAGGEGGSEFERARERSFMHSAAGRPWASNARNVGTAPS